MGAIRLGKILLRWCDTCDLPLLEEGKCGICGSEGRRVDMTPPGDPRPAFPEDIARIRSLIDSQFGEGSGVRVIPEGRIALLNKVPALDRMDEVILGGEVVGAIRFDMDLKWRFIMRMCSASAIQGEASRGTVVADIGAVKPIISGKNLMAPGVTRASEGIESRDEIMILDPDGRAIATGTARMSSVEMMDLPRGVAVKTRWTGEPSDPVIASNFNTLEDVVRGNQHFIDERVEEAIRFVRRTMERNPLSTVVSFSGGKDSLACALIAMDAGLKLPLLFVDTDLEFPETVEYVNDFASENGLELIIGSASMGTFMEGVERFGPPGRDFRWCCKTNKLGPTVRAIMENFPDGVLSFIGQRRYESESRSEKPRVWRNPWVPGQVGAAPIQHWTSMHVWTYIFSKGAMYNPWYERGLDRIGCYLCPASDLGEQGLVESKSEEFRKWKASLYRYAEERGLPLEWVTHALWRWRRVPGSVRRELSRFDVSLESKRLNMNSVVELRMDRSLVSDDEPAAKGRFSPTPDLETMENLLNMMGEVHRSGSILEVDGARLEGDRVTIDSEDADEIARISGLLLKIARKTAGCVGCGICLGRCEHGALHLEGRRVMIAEELCVHCGDCVEPCPALTFGYVEFEF